MLRLIRLGVLLTWLIAEAVLGVLVSLIAGLPARLIRRGLLPILLILIRRWLLGLSRLAALLTGLS